MLAHVSKDFPRYGDLLLLSVPSFEHFNFTLYQIIRITSIREEKIVTEPFTLVNLIVVGEEGILKQNDPVERVFFKKMKKVYEYTFLHVSCQHMRHLLLEMKDIFRKTLLLFLQTVRIIFVRLFHTVISVFVLLNRASHE